MSLRSIVRTIIVCTVAVTLPFSAFATGKPVGTPGGGGSVIEWQLKVTGHERIELMVLDPEGESYSRTFGAGKTPSFRVLDLGDAAADGQYNYELRVVPKIPEGLRKQLESARAAGDDAAIKRLSKQAGITSQVVQSGSFTILNGMIVSPNGTEPDANDSASAARPFESNATTNANRPTTPVANDQVIPDDLIVQGSICTGFDCVNGESFGADTLKLKENNLRIFFEDTSTSAGYPANDWRLIANDNASGGANFFAIEDSTAARNPFYVEAAAPANSIYIDSTGNIGFQQSAPGLDLHLTVTDTPALRLEQTSGGGFTAQTWDIAGNEANFFIRDLTGGSLLPFRIRPGAPTSSIDIAASGNVGLRTTSPAFDLDVRGDATATSNQRIAVGADPTNGPAMIMGHVGGVFGNGATIIHARGSTGSTAPNPSLRLMTNETVRVLIDNEGYIGLGGAASGNPDAPIQYINGASTARLTTAGVWQDASSRTAKDAIVELDASEAVAALAELNPVKYHYKVAPEDQKVGFIAEDVPAIVATPQRDGLSALDIVAVVTKVVQEQQKTIDELKQRIHELENNQK